MSENRPVHEIRSGSIKAAIWANPSEKGEFYTVTFARVYRNGDGLKDSRSFGPYDLWPLVRVAASTYAQIAKRAREAEEGAGQAVTE